jgi:hypothetical protein
MYSHRVKVLLSAIILVSVAVACADEPKIIDVRRDKEPPQSPFGSYIGQVSTAWLPDGRTMKLLAGFAYRDPLGLQWDAQSGSVVDGASIPRVLWSIAGGPFEGQYRDASVLHDVACQKRNEVWRKVHEMFYNACRCSGVSEFRSKLMYAAVYHFGPRWGNATEPETALRDEDDFDRLVLTIANEPTIQARQIEQLTAGGLRQRIPRVPTRAPRQSLMLPTLDKALGRGKGQSARAVGSSELEVMASGEAEARIMRERLQAVTSESRIAADVEAKGIEQQIVQASDAQNRSELASKLLTVTRKRAALHTEIKVRVRPR